MTGYKSKKAAAQAKTIDQVNWVDHEPKGEHMKVQPTTKQLIAMLYERIPELFERQRPWVGLTLNEIALIHADYPHPQGFAQAIEAALRSKNT